MQKELTEAQLSEIPRYRTAWTAHGLNCEPANRPEAEKFIDMAYESIKSPAPRFKVWAGSPLMGSFMGGLFADPDKGAYVFINRYAEGLSELVNYDFASVDIAGQETVVDDNGAMLPGATLSLENAWRSLWIQLVNCAVAKRVSGNKEATPENKDLTYTVEIILDAFARAGILFTIDIARRIGQLMWDAQIAGRKDAIESAGRQKAWDACYGSHDASWLGFYEFFLQVVGYEKCSELNGLIGAAKTCGWFWPFESLAICTERHSFISLDERERLSNKTRAAVEYPDGWKIFAWEGIQLPQWLIETPETLTAQHILTEKNAEVRRAMLSGWMDRGRFIRESGAKLISEDQYGKLYRFQSEGLTVSAVEVINGTVNPDGTRKTYWLGALNTHQTPRETVAWSYNLQTEDYSPVLRT